MSNDVGVDGRKPERREPTKSCWRWSLRSGIPLQGTGGRGGVRAVNQESSGETYIVEGLEVDSFSVVNQLGLRGRVRIDEEAKDVGQDVVIVEGSGVGRRGTRAENAGGRSSGGSGVVVVSGHCRARR